ncbi:DUF445 domain-containing protein [Brevibacterium paucivorans]
MDAEHMNQNTPPSLATPPGETPEDEQARRAALSRMRAVATGLLILAALIFITVHLFTDQTGVWGFVSRASEAAMIGGLADWFAVTALFRHPLGVPIPHTAIIPRKKDVLGESMSTFVAMNFLRAETVAPKIRSAQVTKRVGAWLSVKRNQDIVVERAGQGINYVLARVDDSAIESLTRNVLVPKLIATHKSPVVGRLLTEIVRDGAHHRLVDLVVYEAYAWLERNPQVIEQIVGDRSPEWMPKFVNRTVASRLQTEVLGWVADVRDDRYHQARQALDRWLLELSRDLGEDTSIAQRAEVVFDDLLAQDGVVESVLDIWTSLKRLLYAAVEDSDGEVKIRVRQLLTETADRMQNDTEFATMLDQKLATTAGDLTESFGPELASVISDTIASWDAKDAANKIELYVGKDLQYIRINGTVVGALVGLLIHAITVLVPGL